jgi:hypothetical protein
MPRRSPSASRPNRPPSRHGGTRAEVPLGGTDALGPHSHRPPGALKGRYRPQSRSYRSQPATKRRKIPANSRPVRTRRECGQETACLMRLGWLWLSVCGIAKKGFWPMPNGLTRMDLGARCNEARHDPARGGTTNSTLPVPSRSAGDGILPAPRPVGAARE